LFVVARLAARHGIRVRLRSASMGGLTALVWLPDEAIAHETAAPSPGLRRFEAPVAAPTSPAKLADWPEPGQPEDRSAAMQAVDAARTPRFTPLRPEAGDTATFPALDGEDTGVLAAAADAAAPEETQPGPAPAFGAAAADGAPAAEDDPPAADQPPIGAALLHDNTSYAAPGVIVPPPAGLGEENRLPIFESVESDWFRRGRHGTDHPTKVVTGAASTTSDWTSPADAGWEAAEVAHAPVSAGTTVAGLPKRVPKANLVPGGVGGTVAPAASVHARSASQARERLASFQRGVREGRAAAQDDEAPSDGGGSDALWDAFYDALRDAALV